MDIFGYPGAIPLESERTSDPVTGRTFTYRWKCPLAIKDTFVNALEGEGYAVTASPDGETGWYIVSARSGGAEPGDETVNEQWSLNGNNLEKSIWNIPKVVAMFAQFLDVNGYPKPEYFQRKRDIEDIVEGTKFVSSLSWWATASSDWKKLVRAVMRGEEAKPIGQYVAQRTRIYPRFSIIPKAVMDNVNGVYTQAAFLRVEVVPSEWQLILPTPGYWVKQPPEITQATNGKWTVVNEWWHVDTYDDFLYDNVIT